jgi:predicted subunit of tRNA(5-methylaminomethyl-2-thiouridylate) methyltransferase
MPRTHVRFKQSEIVRAIRAISQSGEQMAMEILCDGTIRIVPVIQLDREQIQSINERQSITL